MGYSFTINISGGSLAVAVIFVPVLWHRFFRPSLRRFILELKADSYNLGLRDGEERARQKTLQKQSRDEHLTLEALHMKIDVLCENIKDMMEGREFCWRALRRRWTRRRRVMTILTTIAVSPLSPISDEFFFSEDIAVNGDLERYGFTTQLTRRQREDDLEVGDRGRGGAPMPETGVRPFLETPD
jgi:hypothetical protein